MSRLVAAACAGVFLAGAALRIANAGTVKDRTPDERVYTRQAVVLIDEGVAGVRGMVEAYLRSSGDAKMYPPPTRVGYLGMLSFVILLTGDRGENAGAWLSCFCSILALAVAIGIGYRLFGPWVGLLTGVFLAVFPPELVVARRAWQDAVVGCFTLLLIYCASTIAEEPRRSWASGAIVIFGSAFLLVKETALIVWGLCLLWAAGNLVWRRDWRRTGILVLAAAAGAAAAIGLLSRAAGGLRPVWQIVSGWNAVNAANPYAIEYLTGPGYLLLPGFWKLSPVVTMLALAGLALVIASRGQGTRNGRVALALAGFVLSFAAIPVILPHWLNLRYLSPIYGSACILAAIAVVEAARVLRPRLEAADVLPSLTLAALLLGIAAVTDYQRFDAAFVERGTPDLSIRMVLESPRSYH